MAAVVRNRGWLYDLFTHNFAEGLRTMREVVRKKHGLEMSDLPYPGSVQVTGNTLSPTAQLPAAPAAAPASGMSGLAKTGLVAGAIGLAGLGGYGLSQLPAKPASTMPTTTAPANPPAPTVPATMPPSFDDVTQVQQPDGSWKETQRQPLPVPKP